MDKDRELLSDILKAAAKLLAQEALRVRVEQFGSRWVGASEAHVHLLNAGVRCLVLAERYEKEQK